MTTPRTPETVSAKPDPALAAQAATSRESTSAAMTKAALTSEALEDVDVRAREVEQQMTDDERFSLIVSLIGPASRRSAFPATSAFRKRSRTRARATRPACRGSASRRCRASDASMGVTNPGYRPRRQGRDCVPGVGCRRARASTRSSRARGRRSDRARSADARIQRACWPAAESRARPAQRPELRVLLRGSLAQRRSRAPSRSTASRARASSRRSSTTRSTATRLTATGSTRSSTRRRTASPTCSHSRSRSSARSRARS